MALIIGSLFLAGTTAFADNYNQIFMTDANGSTTPKTNFGWNETPWLYVKLSEIAESITSAWWTDPNGNKYKIFDAFSTDDIWLSPLNWSTIKKLGEWTITAVSHLDSGTVNQGRLSFTVTPEPVSSLLFILGGGALAGTKLMRSRKK